MRRVTRREDTLIEETLYEESLLPVCSPTLLATRGRPESPADLQAWPLLYDLGWDGDWAYWFARQGQSRTDLSRASGFRLYSMLVHNAVNGIGAAIRRSMLIASELERRALVPLFESPCGSARTLLPDRHGGLPAAAASSLRPERAGKPHGSGRIT